MNKESYSQGGFYTPGREARWVSGAIAVKNILNKIGQDQIFKILDVGSGDGSFWVTLSEILDSGGYDRTKIQYYGLDSDKRFEKHITKNGGIFIHGDIMNLRAIVGSNRYDFIVASEIIEHVDETDELIESLRSVLKPNGQIFLTTPNLAAWHSRLMLLFGYQPLSMEVSNVRADFGKGNLWKKYYVNPIHHIRNFTFRAMEQFVDYHDLEIVKSLGVGYRWYDSVFSSKILKGLAPVIIMILRKKRKYISKQKK